MTAIEQVSTIHFVQKTSESNVVCFAENMLGKSQLLIQIPNARKLENTKGNKNANTQTQNSNALAMQNSFIIFAFPHSEFMQTFQFIFIHSFIERIISSYPDNVLIHWWTTANITTLMAVTAVGLIIIIICAFMWRYKFKSSTVSQRSSMFLHGNPESLNPDMTLDEQAYLLPYDMKYEFPRRKLKLGELLGSGAFGMVLKASAYGISTDEEETTVAIKTIKSINESEVRSTVIRNLIIIIIIPAPSSQFIV